MEIKKDILWRVYLSYIAIALVGLLILGKAIYIQQAQGGYWRGMSDSLHQQIVNLDAERGTIYSEDGSMLSTSIPQFDIYIDFKADGLRQKNGKLFRENVDSLSIALADLFKDKNRHEYKKLLQDGYREKDRYFLLHRKLSYKTYQQLKTFPLVRLGRNKSGFIPDKKIIRLNPYRLLAYRTIGLLRDDNKVGLERTYNDMLTGIPGKRLVQFIAGGAGLPIKDYEVEPENGKDIITTLDVNIQDITENALMKMMVQNQAAYGCAIVMEVNTGKIKAIANLGRGKNGSYWEDYNYAITPSEPGSTIKLATMLALLEDKKVNLHTPVELHGGTWQINGRTIYDSEKHGLGRVSVKAGFEHSSNVAMGKLAWIHYGANPSAFINHLKRLRLDSLTGIDLAGEIKPTLYSPKSRNWSRTTLPWMAFGYNLAVTPLQVLTMYNAVANNGVMLKPYLVNAIQKDGIPVYTYQPTVLRDKIASEQTIKMLKSCLEGVMENGTGKTLRSSLYKIAGKTGTALVANGNRGYADKVYQSSFAGYFPANDPQYSVIVVIKNKPHAPVYYGAAVAGPVFKEIADKVYALRVTRAGKENWASLKRNDSISFNYGGYAKDLRQVTSQLELKVKEDDGNGRYSRMYKKGNAVAMVSQTISNTKMPSLMGMGLKDAVYLCENLGLRVQFSGKGKVMMQSVAAGQKIAPGQHIKLHLQ